MSLGDAHLSLGGEPRRPVPQTATPVLAARLAVVRGASQLGNPDGFDTEDIWRELKTALAYLDQAIREGKR